MTFIITDRLAPLNQRSRKNPSAGRRRSWPGGTFGPSKPQMQAIPTRRQSS